MLHPWLEPYFAQFVAALRQGRLPNSVIISGVEGLGGNELALAMAQYYLCHDPKEHGSCGVCRSCAAFKRLMHQDLKVAYTSTAESHNLAEGNISSRLRLFPVSSDILNVFNYGVIFFRFFTLFFAHFLHLSSPVSGLKTRVLF